MPNYLPSLAIQDFSPGKTVVVPITDERIRLPEDRKLTGFYWQHMDSHNPHGIMMFSGRFGCIQHVAYCMVEEDGTLTWKGDGPLFHDGPSIEPGALAVSNSIVIPVILGPDKMIYVGMNKARRTAIVNPETLEQGVETWEFPGGYSLEGEDAIEQVRRHALEEAGFALEGEPEFIGAASPNRMQFATCVRYYMARFRVVKPIAYAQGFEDILGHKIFRIDHIPAWNLDGLIWTAWGLAVNRLGLINPRYYDIEDFQPIAVVRDDRPR